MPTFGRLGKHSNRSQQALVEQQLAAGGASATESPAAANHSTPLSALPSSHNTAFSSSESFSSRAQQQQQQQTQHQLPPPPSSSASQSQPQSSPSAPPPPRLYNSPAGNPNNSPLPPLPSLQNPGPAGSPAFDARQKHPDFADPAAVSRSQSHRFSAVSQQQQQALSSQLYGIASSSVDDLSNANYPPGPATQQTQQVQVSPQPQNKQQQQQTTPVPEKRSTRKLIKGIFSGSSSRGTSDNSQHHHHHSFGLSHSHQQSYDNSSGLSRKPSKRVSKNAPPSLTTSFSQVSQTSPDRPTEGWQQQQPQQYHPQSPLQGAGEVDEYYNPYDSNSYPPSQNSRVSLHNTIHQVSGELEQSPYEEVVYRPHQQGPLAQQQQQPHVQVHLQEQQLQQQGQLPTPSLTRYNTGQYEDPSPQSSLHHIPQQHFPFGNSQQAQYQQGGDSRILQSHLGVSTKQQNPETVSQFSHESPVTDSDQRSTNLQSAQNSPAVKHSVYIQNQGSTTSLPPVLPAPPQQTQTQHQHQSGMAPPPAGGPPPAARRNQEAEKGLRSQVEPSSGPPPGYRHSTASMNNMNPLPPPPQQSGGQSSTFRGDRPSPFDGPTGDTGRNSPQPSTAESAEGEKQFKDLLTKYKNVKRLYFDGKSQIEQLTGQVEHLQNAVANQRMSQSRTALDDNEYSTRFNRLNGAINNLAFNIRKDWRSVPQWLDKFVSVDALKTGKQEMTAVGRAVISRWLVEEIFNKCFHPGLDQVQSAQLKDIEMNIRQNSYTLSSQEEFDALTTKVVNWRMATLEGLHRKLNSPATTENRNNYTAKATTNLTACLYQYLVNPPPPGVEGSTSMIVELAVAIAANLPLESRDVVITYPLPGDAMQPNLMEVEKTPLPTLEGHGDGHGDDEGDKDKNGKSRTDKAKIGTFTAAPGGGPPADRKGSNASTLASTNTDAEAGLVLPKDSGRIRFAGFVALEVRGRQVLMKAPVWAL